MKCKVLYTSDFAAPTGNYRPVLMNELNMFFVPIKKQPFRKGRPFLDGTTKEKKCTAINQ